MRILSLDVGFKNIGVAISSVDRNLIFPLGVLKMSQFDGKVFFDLLKKCLEKYWEEIDCVIVGDGRDFEKVNPIIRIVSQVERILRSWTSWNVVSKSEVNSSIESRKFLEIIGASKKWRLNVLDSYSALFILKEYFDSINRDVLVSF